MRSARTSASAQAAPPRGGVEVDQRHDVDRSDVRVRAGRRRIAARAGDDIDRLDRHARAAQQRVGERSLAPGEREHRAMVVAVAVHVEQPDLAVRRGVGRECGGERVDGARVAALGDVGHGEQDRRCLFRG